MTLNPSFFKIVYTDLLNTKKTRQAIEAALDAIDEYIAARTDEPLRPVIEHLREVGEVRSCTEIETHFERNFDVSGVTTACEYLADRGLIGKASTPVRLTKRSNIDVQELAFFYVDAGRRSRVVLCPCRAARASSFKPQAPSLPPSLFELRRGRLRVPRPAARTTIAVQGARVHNLKNISVEIPRDSLIVVTGLSGSGKSSLAFDTIYAEGQRRYMESLSSYAKRFVAQVAKPDVDFVFGLSPVISIEQKTLTATRARPSAR